MSVKAAEVSRRFQTQWACKELRARSSSLLRLCRERSSGSSRAVITIVHGPRAK